MNEFFKKNPKKIKKDKKSSNDDEIFRLGGLVWLTSTLLLCLFVNKIL